MSTYDWVSQSPGGSPQTGEAADETRPTLTELPFPPTSWALTAWGPAEVLQADVNVWKEFGDASNINQTVNLVGAIPKVALIATVPDDVIEAVDAGADTLQLTGHSYVTGDGPLKVVNAGGALPGGVELNADYWIRVVDANNVELHTSLGSSMSDGSADDGGKVDLTSAGSGTNTITFVSGKTRRVLWFDLGEVELASGEANLAWTQRFEFHPDVRALALAIFSGNLGTTVAVNFKLVRARVA